MPWRRLALLSAIVAVVALCGGWGYALTVHAHTDWVFFEVGAREIVHYQGQSIYADPALHVYVANPDLQIGPPALLSVAAFEWLPFRVTYVMFAALMAASAPIALMFAYRAANVLRVRTSKTLILLLAALPVMAIWSFQATAWKHLDDVMALTLAAAATFAIARRRPWWLVGLLLGTAVAAKPWAIILAPMLLGIARQHRAKATLATIATAGAWWLPFVVAAPDTISALGHFPVFAMPGSVLSVVGMHGHVERWLRPVQFLLGVSIGLLAARREWVSAPLAALAVRVLTDPYSYGYYDMGPLLFAFMYDATGAGWRGLPTYTGLTTLLVFLPPAVGMHGLILGVLKLVWGVVVLTGIALRRRRNVSVAVLEAPRELVPAAA